MGNYLYDDYEAKKKVTNDIINDYTFYKKLRENFVSPKKIFLFVEIIFASFKCPPYHTKFLQIFYNYLNIFERDEYFEILRQLKEDLTENRLSFHESYNNFNKKLCDIKAKNPDRSIKPKKDAIDFFFLYVNFHINEFENIKNRIKHIVKEVNAYPQKLGVDPSIKKIVYDEIIENKRIELTYIGNMENEKKDGQGMLISKDKSNGQIVSTYIGEFKNDKKNGFGLIKKEKEQIEGSFVNDEADGKMGIYTESSKCYAEYKNGIKNGRYIELKNDGSIYTNEYKNDVLSEAFSIYTKSRYFITGKRLGDDILEGVSYDDEDGNVKVGTFDKQLRLQGDGYIYKNNEAIYCTFEDGNIIPSQCYICEDDGRISFGYCNENGELNGKDIFTFLYNNDEYKGDLIISDYINGKPTGKHEYYWGDGDYEKINENRIGMRSFKDKERIMVGTFAGNGFPKGYGYFIYKGTKYEGTYDLNDQRCLFISFDRRAYKSRISHAARFNEAVATQYKVEVNN